MKKWFALFTGMLLSGTASAQPVLRMRGLHPDLQRSWTQDIAPKTRMPGRSHLVVQFAHNPSGEELEQLENRGAIVLSYIPDFAYSISLQDGATLAGLDLQWVGRLRPQEKLSAELEGRPSISAAAISAGTISAIVELYPDVDWKDGRAITIDAGLRILENPDLLPGHLLVRGTRQQMLALAEWDEVSYIFPASRDLLDGRPVHGCAGALTSQGTVSQAIPLIGDGWDGPGLGTANLTYAFKTVTAKLPAGAPQSEIARAFAEWSKYVQVTFTPVTDPNGNRSVDILFATGAHGDPYPFSGALVLAHTFYPFPSNPEPIAGDMHLNDALAWRIGSNVDLFSVALHEAGHTLGLGHSDKPGDVMYPYYQMHTGLLPDDIQAAQELYAAAGTASPAPTPTPSNPLVLIVIAPPASSSVSPISLSGTVSGGSGPVQVTWKTGAGAFGAAQGSPNWIIPSVPLISGGNVITIAAQDSLNNLVNNSVTVNYQPTSDPPPPPNPPPPPPPPTPPPSGPDTTAPSLTILSPATNNYVTSSSSLVVSGTATDNVGVASVTWATSNGTSGTASGTANWSTPAIAIYIGTTTIVITAADAAGNKSWRSLTVTRGG